MASIISAGTTSATALNMSADTSGVLQLASNNGTVAVTVTAGQGVGILNTSPTETFVVGSATADTRATFRPNTAFAIGVANGAGFAGWIGGSGVADTMVFSSSGGTERLRIDAYGNTILGGTTGLGASGGRLAVYGTSGGQNGFIQVTNPGYGTGVLGVQGTSSNFKIYNSYSTGTFSGGVGIDINTSGNVGIGTTSPATLLHLAGTGTSLVRIQSTNSTAGAEIIGVSCLLNSANATSSDYAYLAGIDGGSDRFYVLGNGDVRNTNNSYGAISDQKFKQDIVDATSQWDDIKNLRFRKYRLKDNPQGPLQLGLISQEAELVSPGLIDEFNEYGYVEVVDEDGNVTQERKATGEKIKAIKYSILYMKATKALQEAMQRIEALEAKVGA